MKLIIELTPEGADVVMTATTAVEGWAGVLASVTRDVQENTHDLSIPSPVALTDAGANVGSYWIEPTLGGEVRP